MMHEYSASSVCPGSQPIVEDPNAVPAAHLGRRRVAHVGAHIGSNATDACLRCMTACFFLLCAQGASQSLKIPMPFLVTIVLPIVGNAAEHASALIFAWKNRMEIALGVAVGTLISYFCVVCAGF